MSLWKRINPFWLGAGLLLTTFGANEIVAYVTSKVPRWLGGPMALAGAIVAALLGLVIVFFLGIEEAPET